MGFFSWFRWFWEKVSNKSRGKRITSFPSLDLDHPKTPCQTKYHNVFASAASIYDCVVGDLAKSDLVDEQVITIDSDYLEEIAVSSVMAAALRRYRRLFVVAWDGDGETSLILTRSLFDLMVTMLLIKQDPKNAELYVKFGAIEHKWMLDQLETSFSSTVYDKKKKEEILKIYDSFEPLFKNNRGKVRRRWHPLNFTDRASRVGLDLHQEIGFDRYSKITHGNFSALLEYAEVYPEGKLRISILASDKNIGEAITESGKFLLIIFAAFAETFGLNDLSPETVGGYQTLLKHKEYQDCLAKNLWLKEWMEKIIGI